uniref:Uncharacterized protein n=1 Tax=Anguilla anguilla TaxID=7936 RepID=A0A0E9QTQ5_ANGAN
MATPCLGPSKTSRSIKYVVAIKPFPLITCKTNKILLDMVQTHGNSRLFTGFSRIHNIKYDITISREFTQTYDITQIL